MTAFSDDEAFAAEYVLGTLDRDERAAAELRLARDARFAELVRAWDIRLSPLAAAVPEVAPPPGLFGEVLSRVSAKPPASPTGDILLMRRQVRTWRGIAAVASALAAVMALWIVGGEIVAPAPPPQTYVAVLQHGADTPSFVVSLDVANRRMVVVPLATSAPPDKSYEVWMIGAGQAAPQSIGIIDAQATLRRQLPAMDKAAMSGATYAVTLEPHGGSPTGQPTSTPIFVGKPTQVSL